jgi:hypothetical protein
MAPPAITAAPLTFPRLAGRDVLPDGRSISPRAGADVGMPDPRGDCFTPAEPRAPARLSAAVLQARPAHR